MTLYSDPLVVGLWICIIVAEGYLLGVLLGRKACTHFRAFTWFTGFCVARSLALFYFAHKNEEHFQIVTWCSYPLQLILILMLVIEVFQKLFHPTETLPPRTLTSFVQAAAALVIVTIVIAIRFPGEQAVFWLTLARATDQATSWVFLALFCSIAVLAAYLGIPWTDPVCGIGIGFIFYLAVDAVVTTVVAQTQYDLIWPVDMIAFLLASFVWIIFFLKPELHVSAPNREQLDRLKRQLKLFKVSVETAQPKQGEWGPF